ncbi:MAG TPA: hypothetical protein VMB02_01925, partial [Candidatus Aquilonibacter sp.]|nr:hypothetical protein [Candidatus Aquilonibacter sp.]
MAWPQLDFGKSPAFPYSTASERGRYDQALGRQLRAGFSPIDTFGQHPVAQAATREDIEFGIQRERHDRHFSAGVGLRETTDNRSTAADLRHRHPSQRFGKQGHRLSNYRIHLDMSLPARRADRDFAGGLRD